MTASQRTTAAGVMDIVSKVLTPVIVLLVGVMVSSLSGLRDDVTELQVSISAIHARMEMDVTQTARIGALERDYARLDAALQAMREK